MRVFLLHHPPLSTTTPLLSTHRWCIWLMLDARCANWASSTRLRTATGGGGSASRPAADARPPAGVRDRPRDGPRDGDDAFFTARGGGAGVEDEGGTVLSAAAS